MRFHLLVEQVLRSGFFSYSQDHEGLVSPAELNFQLQLAPAVILQECFVQTLVVLLEVELLPLISQSQIPYIAMHKQGDSQTMQINPTYNNVVNDILTYFIQKKKLFDEIGIYNWALDLGFGFGKICWLSEVFYLRELNEDLGNKLENLLRFKCKNFFRK